MSTPIKNMFSHGLFEAKATTPEALGTLRILADGRKFRLAKAGAAALSPGKLAVAPDAVANHINLTGSAIKVGESRVPVTVGATAVTDGQYVGGFLQINAGTGAGMQYKIQSHGTCAASGVLVVVLEEPIRVALDATSKLSLIPCPWNDTVESATEENLPVGITLCPVPAGYFYWAQTSGQAVALIAGTPAKGTMLVPGATAGSLAAMNATLDIDQPVVATMGHTAGVDGQYKPVLLAIE
jgi:hypothetical protein